MGFCSIPLGARIGATLVLHSWGSQLTDHPHVHGIVPGGGLAADADRWVPCRPGFFLPVRVLSRFFRRRILEELACLHARGELQFFGEHTELADPVRFAEWLTPLRQVEWVVYAKRPFAGPSAVLAYLSRYTHRVAISNRRLIAHDERGVTFRWKDYRVKGRTRYKTMTLPAAEFMRRFLLHVLPRGFHRIRHYGLLGDAHRTVELATVRALLHVAPSAPEDHHRSSSRRNLAPVRLSPLRSTDDHRLRPATAAAYPHSASFAMRLNALQHRPSPSATAPSAPSLRFKSP